MALNVVPGGSMLLTIAYILFTVLGASTLYDTTLVSHTVSSSTVPPFQWRNEMV